MQTTKLELYNWGIEMNDAQIREMVSYVVKHMKESYPENLEVMVHLIGHEEEYRKKVEQITEETLDNHDELFLACGNGKPLEEITPQFADQCEKTRQKMLKLVEEYLLQHS